MFSPVCRATASNALPARTPPGLPCRGRLLVLTCALLLPWLPASAQLMVHPTRIVFDSHERSAQLEIINNSNETATYRLALVNRRMDENGGLSEVETAAAGEQFAGAMLRYSPRRVTLAPGASQVVRVMARRPADLAAGEYRSHLLFAEQADPAPAVTGASATGDKSGIAIALTALVGVSIPVIVREGETNATVTLGKLALAATAPGQPALLSFDMQRSGNRSVYGDLSVSFSPRDGTTREIGRAGGVAIYTPNALRHAKLQLEVPVDMLASGELRVSYHARPEQGGELLATASLMLP